MNLLIDLYIALLFIVLTPGLLLTLPSGASKLTVAVVHALLFTVVYHFTHRIVLRNVSEGFQVSDALKACMAATENLPKSQQTSARAKCIQTEKTGGNN